MKKKKKKVSEGETISASLSAIATLNAQIVSTLTQGFACVVEELKAIEKKIKK